jgi:hypothetical protein
MSQEGWGSLGNIANTTAITTAAYSGVQFVLAGYRYASPYTTLAESEKKLKRVKSRLQGLSPRRREEIETASQGKDDSKSLELLEEQLDECVLLVDVFSFSNSKFTVGVPSLVNMYCRLSKRCDEARFPERHNPYSEFRIQVSGLEQSAKALLNDTFVSFLIRIVL